MLAADLEHVEVAENPHPATTLYFFVPPGNPPTGATRTIAFGKLANLRWS
jgi:hypothetical protein